MSTTAVIILVAVIVAAVVVAWWLMMNRNRRGLQDRFGGEYERVVEDAGSKRKAERELAARTERHEQLHVTPLSAERQEGFAQVWATVQARFVDDPAAALGEADRLVQQVMVERGYPTGDFDQRTADLSVEHADVLDHYRAAHHIAGTNANGGATTEDLRQGMVHYRALFAALIESVADEDETEEEGRRA